MGRNSYLGGGTVLTGRNLNWKSYLSDPKLSTVENNIANCRWAIKGIETAFKYVDSLLEDGELRVYVRANRSNEIDEIERKLIQANELFPRLRRVLNELIAESHRLGRSNLSSAPGRPQVKALCNTAEMVSNEVLSIRGRIINDYNREESLRRLRPLL
jgi:hypothetical protein